MILIAYLSRYAAYVYCCSQFYLNENLKKHIIGTKVLFSSNFLRVIIQIRSNFNSFMSLNGPSHQVKHSLENSYIHIDESLQNLLRIILLQI